MGEVTSLQGFKGLIQRDGKKVSYQYSNEMNPKPLNFFLSLAILSLSCETLWRSAIKSD